MAKTMKPEKVLEYLEQENDIHYQHYYAMRELLLSYKLPVLMLETTDEPKAFFDKLYLSYRDPPSTVGSRIIQDTSELIEVIKNNQEIRGFNARMSKEVVGLVNIYNEWIMDKLCKDESNSPARWNSMKETMKRLVQDEEEWKAERANLEGELFLLRCDKSETEERELSALRTKVKLQKDLRRANEMIRNLEKIHSCSEEKLRNRKEMPLTKILQFFCKKLWEENDGEMKVTPNMARDAESSEDDAESSDEDVENSDEDVENSYKLMENSEDDTDETEDMAELSFLQKQKSVIDRWSKEVEKQLEEVRDGSYNQCTEVLVKDAKAIKRASARPEKAP